jgi:hypothetical protein
MIPIPATARQALQESFGEVAFRANRLREWIRFHERLRALENSFNAFLREVRRAVGPSTNFDDVIQNRLRELWSNCQDNDLTELEYFRDGVRYISRPLSTDANAPPSQRFDVAQVINVCEQIRQALNDLSLVQLGQRSGELEMALWLQFTSQRRAVQQEIDELYLLTNNLHAQFQNPGVAGSTGGAAPPVPPPGDD